MKSSTGKGSAIRASILAQVKRCMYVESVDVQQQREEAAGEDDDSPSSVATTYTESFRKHKWLQPKRQQQQQQLIKSRMESAQQREQQEEEEAAREVLRIQQQLALELQQVADAMARKQAERRQRELDAAMEKKMMANKCDTLVPLEFEDFLDELLTSDIGVSCSPACSPLDAKPFDQLGAISIPCKREGNSLTLCCWHSREEEDGDGDSDGESVRHEQLIAFGGRLLQDVTRLLPTAVLSDSMKLERVRYMYSNGVYSYNIASCVWTFRECTGRNNKLPRERSDHSAVFLEPHFLVIFGGRGRNGQVFKDLWVMNLVLWQWSEIDTDTKLVERYWHTCCVNDDSVFVFGGKSEIIAHGDLQQLSVHALREMLLLLEDDTELSFSPSTTKKKKKKPKLSWMCPHTVGKAPSPWFGMSLVTLDYERIAVVGGYRARKKPNKHDLQREPRLMDLHILDTVTMIWSTLRLSSHVSTLTTPAERMLFECFFQHNTVIVFGGFTYATNGETESFTPRDDSHVVYKLDVNRMIWRRQILNHDHNADWLPAPHVHASSNAVLGERGFTCYASEHQTLMQLAAFHIQPKAAHGRSNGTKSLASAPIEPEEQQAELITSLS